MAFVRHFIDVLNHVNLTLQAQTLKQYATADCSACTSIIASVEDLRAEGGHIDGGQWTVLESRTVPVNARKGTRVQVVVRYPEQHVVRAAGEDAQRFKAGQTFYEFDLRWRANGWLVSAISGGS